MTTAILIAIYIGLVLWLVAYVRKGKEERNALIQINKAHAERLMEIEDAISASPFVQYPYLYTNSTRKY
jgi:hypothetical protein